MLLFLEAVQQGGFKIHAGVFGPESLEGGVLCPSHFSPAARR
jgi:hypothetical protein